MKDQLLPTHKICNYCKTSKPLDSFHKKKAGKYGRNGRCKPCISKTRKHEFIEKVEQKKCNRCDKTKSIDSFGLDSSSRDGHKTICKQCKSVINKDYNTKNSERILANKRRYYLENAEEIIIKRREYRKKNSDVLSQRQRKYYLKNREYIIERQSKITKIRRARLFSAFVEPVCEKKLFIRDEGLCYVCSKKIDLDLSWPHPMSKSLEHIIPLSKGGKHSYENTALSHLVCNIRKGSSLPDSLETRRTDLR